MWGGVVWGSGQSKGAPGQWRMEEISLGAQSCWSHSQGGLRAVPEDGPHHSVRSQLIQSCQAARLSVCLLG